MSSYEENVPDLQVDIIKALFRMLSVWQSQHGITHLPPGQNDHHFADDILNNIFLNESVGISIQISLKFVSKGPIDNKSA